MGILDDRSGLQGKTAFIVGGGDGVGREISIGLAKCGVNLAICDRNKECLDETHTYIEDIGNRVVSMYVNDASTYKNLKEFYEYGINIYNKIDIVVNVVGGGTRRRFIDSTTEQCEKDIRLNYGYIVDSLRLALPVMIKNKKGGSIINFTTVEAHRGAAGYAVYAGAKAATTNFTRALAVELGSHGIRVNSIAPDASETPNSMSTLEPDVVKELSKIPLEVISKSMKMYIPLGKPAALTDVANGVIFLASDLSKSITGTTIHVDGGTWASFGFIDWPFGDGYLPVPMANTLKKLFMS